MSVFQMGRDEHKLEGDLLFVCFHLDVCLYVVF
jgi:hypothetical protein